MVEYDTSTDNHDITLSPCFGNPSSGKPHGPYVPVWLNRWYPPARWSSCRLPDRTFSSTRVRTSSLASVVNYRDIFASLLLLSLFLLSLFLLLLILTITIITLAEHWLVSDSQSIYKTPDRQWDSSDSQSLGRKGVTGNEVWDKHWPYLSFCFLE